MTPFVAIAIVLAVVVLLVVLRPLWRPAPAAGGAVVGACLLLVGGLYALVGTPSALDAVNVQQPTTLTDAVGQLEAALQRDPSQVEGWRLLGQAYASGNQLDKARDAYARAAALAPDQSDILVEAAQASALADPQRRFDPAAVALLRHALAVQPQHQRARWFLGIAEFQAGKPADAAATWEPLLAQVDANTATQLRAQIDIARARAGLPALAEPATKSADRTLRVSVALDPEFAARVRLDGTASVFVLARQAGGPPMPLAVEKHAVGELPFTTTLEDSDGPMPTMRLSSQDDVEVIARISMSGNAMPQPGDISSTPVRVRLPHDGTVQLTLGAKPRP
jgi:cytochrome c-type biogenesis protein CcmH